jgi:ribosome-associated protein
MANFSLGKHPHVELCDLLKLEGWSESGAQAKIAIADGLVKVDGAVETRKRCKIVAGQTVSFEGQSVTVTELRRRNRRLKFIPIRELDPMVSA